MSSSLKQRHSRVVGKENSGQVQRLASDAAAVALNAQQPRRAVELLEQGRGVLLAQLVRYRTSLDDLQAVSPSLAARFKDLSSQLEQSVNADGAGNLSSMKSPSDRVGRHQNLSRRWDETVTQIRALEGFTSFLRPTPFEVLNRAANEGPVIIVNISEIRSDAIMLRSGEEPAIIKLPGATLDEIRRIASLMDLAIGESQSYQRLSTVVEVLRDLWGCVAQPVVKRPAALKVARNSRIWWCPTSSLCSLPLHAAGIYSAKQSKLPDIFISSYTPTLSALIRARSRPSNLLGPPSILAIGVPQPDGRDGADGALHFVNNELQRLLKCVPDATLMDGQNATHDAILEQLPVHSWVHLSCHGHQNMAQPFLSRFRLQDRPLRMQEIVRMDLLDAELAFLSACHTATRDQNTPDEGLHLAAYAVHGLPRRGRDTVGHV